MTSNDIEANPEPGTEWQPQQQESVVAYQFLRPIATRPPAETHAPPSSAAWSGEFCRVTEARTFQATRQRPAAAAAAWTGLGGDCPLLRDALAQKQGLVWTACRFLVAYARGFSQTSFSNNPITGLILMVGLITVGPGTFVCCAACCLLGHCVSMALREPQVNLDNGLTIFNPLIFGAVSYYFVPEVYGAFDGFSSSLMFLCVIFISYFWRACGNGCVPCLTMPFNVAELILLFTLKHARSQMDAGLSVGQSMPAILMDNGTAIAASALASASAAAPGIVENATVVTFDWGMIVRASVVSASQLFVVESVAFGAIVYLAVLIYSPVTCLFGFLGSLGASIVALQVGSSHAAIGAGLYGFNGYLTGASLGGSFLVINGQMAAASCVAIVLTGLMQHVLEIIFMPTGLPVGTIPFVLTTWLFIGLGKTPEGAFFYPLTISCPEQQRKQLLSQRRVAKLEQICAASEPQLLLRNGKASSA